MPYPANLLPSPFQDRIDPSIPEDDYIDVNGQAVPIWLTGPEAEYEAFRNNVGLIDFSMLFKFELKGEGAVNTLNQIFSRDVAQVPVGGIAYGVIVNPDGGMLDDCTVLVYSQEHVRITGGTLQIGELLREVMTQGQTLQELRSEIATLSVQGPNSRALLQSVSTDDWSNENFGYYTFKLNFDVAGIKAHVNRMGFTAELGYEVMVDKSDAIKLWDALIAAGEKYGVVACAAGALMTVRVEAGMIMSGLEYDETISPYECRMGWSVDLEKPTFRGKDALMRLKTSARSTIVSLIVDSAADGLDGQPIYNSEVEVGHITMAVESPLLKGKTLALARVERPHHTVGGHLSVKFGAELASAEIVATPVYDPNRLRVRS